MLLIQEQHREQNWQSPKSLVVTTPRLPEKSTLSSGEQPDG